MTDLAALPVERLDHVSVAVWDLRTAARLPELLGGRLLDGGRSGDFWWAQWELHGGKLEMIQPVDPDDADHFLVRFLRRRGEGLHHLTFKVTDLTLAVERAEAAGFRVVDVDRSSPTWKEAFIHPKTASGVLIQLAEFEDAPPRYPASLDEVLG